MADTEFYTLLKKIKEDLTPKQIISVVKELGGGNPQRDAKGNLIFPTICHNPRGQPASHKLYYYENSGLFKCYTGCDKTYDIFHLIKQVHLLNNPNEPFSIRDAYNFLLEFKDTSSLVKSFEEQSHINSFEVLNDWNFINKYRTLGERGKWKEVAEAPVIKTYPEEYLQKFFYHPTLQNWTTEQIAEDVLRQFEVNYNLLDDQIVIPYRNIEGKLIGIRARNCNPDALKMGRKYHIATVNGELCTFSSSLNLYGVYQNQEAIRDFQKVIIFEGEKSVLKCNTFYRNDSFAVATGGSSISKYHRSLLLQLGVNEVIIAFDKEYADVGSLEYKAYYKKLRELALKFAPYCQTYLLIDTTNLLYQKNSPIDQGRRVLEKLLANKIPVEPI